MSKRRKSNHNKVVNVVLAAALAFTAVVSTAQLASVSDDLSANVNGRYIAAHNPDCASQGMRYDSATDSCMAGDTGGGGGGGGDTISCNSLGGQSVSIATCNDADSRKGTCESTSPPGTWNTTGGGTCTAGGGGGGTCAAGSPVGNCTTQTACQSAGYFWYNNVCNTTAGGGGGGTCTSGGTASACTTDATCQSANFYWYNSVCNTTAGGGGGGTCAVGSPAGNCTTQAACQSANFYWYNNVCNTTDTAGGGQACSGATPLTCSDGSCAATQLECSNRVGCLDGQVRDSTGQCVADTQRDANVDTNVIYDPAYYGRNRDSAGCIAAGYRWDSGRNDCFPGDLSSVLNTGTWYCGSIGKTFPNGEGGPECNCGDRGGTWSNGECTSASGEAIDTTRTFVFDPFAGDVPQCGPGQYFDFATRACKAAQFNKDAVFSEDHYSTFVCPPWDTRCQAQESDKLFEKPWEQAECLSAGETRSGSTQLGSQLAELQQKFDSTSIANGTDSYAIASANAQLGAAKGFDLKDPCQAGQLKAILEGFDHEGFGMAQMIADFRRELGQIQSEIDLERTRTTNTIAIGHYDAAEAAIAELYANPPPIDEAEPWKLFESLVPPCMKMGGPGMGPGGGNRNFGGPMCTIEEAIVGSTPRGLFMAGMMVANQGMRDEFGGDMCVNAAKHIAVFESKVIPQLSGTAKTTAKELAAKGKALAVACQSAPVNERFTYMQKLEAIGRQAEALMIEAGVDIDFEEFGFEGKQQFDMGGANQWYGSDLTDLITKLIADAVKTATGEMLAQFAAKGFETRILEEIAVTMNSFSGSLAKKVQEGLGGIFETSSYLPEGPSMEAGSEAMEVTSDILQTLNVIGEVAPDYVDDVEGLVEKIVESPLPLEVLDVVKEEIEVAAVIAENGGVLTPKLEAVQEMLDDLDPAELNDARQAEGTWFWNDVSYEDKMWGGGADKYLILAKSALNLSGTKNEEGTYDFAPTKILNVAEGLTAMAKTLDFEGKADPSAEVQALCSAEWAGPWLQEVADAVGINKVKEAITESGGCGGAMQRDTFAGMAKELAANAGVDVSADPNSEIGHYNDFDKMNAKQQSAFAFAHKYGIITGANDGKEANPEGEAVRLEATKMLTELKAAVQEAEAIGTESVAEINTSFLQTFGIEDVEDLVNLEVESLNGGEVNSGDPGSGITVNSL